MGAGQSRKRIMSGQQSESAPCSVQEESNSGIQEQHDARNAASTTPVISQERDGSVPASDRERGDPEAQGEEDMSAAAVGGKEHESDPNNHVVMSTEDIRVLHHQDRQFTESCSAESESVCPKDASDMRVFHAHAAELQDTADGDNHERGSTSAAQNEHCLSVSNGYVEDGCHDRGEHDESHVHGEGHVLLHEQTQPQSEAWCAVGSIDDDDAQNQGRADDVAGGIQHIGELEKSVSVNSSFEDSPGEDEAHGVDARVDPPKVSGPVVGSKPRDLASLVANGRGDEQCQDQGELHKPLLPYGDESGKDDTHHHHHEIPWLEQASSSLVHRKQEGSNCTGEGMLQALSPIALRASHSPRTQCTNNNSLGNETSPGCGPVPREVTHDVKSSQSSLVHGTRQNRLLDSSSDSGLLNVSFSGDNSMHTGAHGGVDKHSLTPQEAPKYVTQKQNANDLHHGNTLSQLYSGYGQDELLQSSIHALQSQPTGLCDTQNNGNSRTQSQKPVRDSANLSSYTSLRTTSNTRSSSHAPSGKSKTASGSMELPPTPLRARHAAANRVIQEMTTLESAADPKDVHEKQMRAVEALKNLEKQAVEAESLLREATADLSKLETIIHKSFEHKLQRVVSTSSLGSDENIAVCVLEEVPPREQQQGARASPAGAHAQTRDSSRKKIPKKIVMPWEEINTAALPWTESAVESPTSCFPWEQQHWQASSQTRQTHTGTSHAAHSASLSASLLQSKGNACASRSGERNKDATTGAGGKHDSSNVGYEFRRKGQSADRIVVVNGADNISSVPVKNDGRSSAKNIHGRVGRDVSQRLAVYDVLFDAKLAEPASSARDAFSDESVTFFMFMRK